MAEGRVLPKFEHEMPRMHAARTVGAEFVKVIDHTDHGLEWNLNLIP